MIDVEKLSLTYGSATQAPAVNSVSFRVKEGQVYTLLGPSGCGKTTTLRCIAGLERPDQGEICVDGVVVSSSKTGAWVSPHRRGIGMVFQSYAIWPHMTVFENVALPLRYGSRRISGGRLHERVMQALALVRLDHVAARPAPQLSGGQQQRLALARTLVIEPKALLLDEPLSNLDAKLREEMRMELRCLVKTLGITTIFVTHEQLKALTLSDVVAVMKDGQIVQEETPDEIYRRPANAFVAEFVGKSNLLDGTVSERGGGNDGDWVRLLVKSTLGDITCIGPRQIEKGHSTVVAIRPEHIEVIADGSPGENTFSGVLETATFIGCAMDCSVRVGTCRIKVQLHPDRTPPIGSEVILYVPSHHCLAVQPDSSKRPVTVSV